MEGIIFIVKNRINVIGIFKDYDCYILPNLKIDYKVQHYIVQIKENTNLNTQDLLDSNTSYQ